MCVISTEITTNTGTLIQLGGRKFAATTTFFQSSPLVLHFRQRWTRIFFILWVDSAADREARTLSCTSLWPPVKRFNPPQFFAYGGIHWHTTASYILCHTSFCQTVYQLLSVTRKKKSRCCWWEGSSSTGMPPISWSWYRYY